MGNRLQGQEGLASWHNKWKGIVWSLGSEQLEWRAENCAYILKEKPVRGFTPGMFI